MHAHTWHKNKKKWFAQGSHCIKLICALIFGDIYRVYRPCLSDENEIENNIKLRWLQYNMDMRIVYSFAIIALLKYEISFMPVYTAK